MFNNYQELQNIFLKTNNYFERFLALEEAKREIEENHIQKWEHWLVSFASKLNH